jgi:hypothetical protein
MPRGDRTGPDGMGPMTGRRLGICAGFDSPGFTKTRPQRGFGRGFRKGRGFGWRARANQFMPIQEPAVTEKEEKQFLEQELTALKGEMKEIENRLKELKK